MNYYKSYGSAISFTDNIYKCYLCKERPTFITKDFYDRHHERFHVTKRYEKITRRNLNTNSSYINGVYSDKYMQTNTKSPHDTLKVQGSYDFDAIHQVIAKQETDINLQHQQLSNIIATYQNNNIYPERLSNLLEKKEKLLLVITELQKLKEQLELSKQLETLAGDIKDKENEIFLLENDKTVLQQDIKEIYSNKQENIVIKKSDENEMQILFESFKSYFQGNTINNHGVVDRCCYNEKINHLANKMKVLEDEVEGLKKDKHQCKQQMKEYQPTESINSLKLLVHKMKQDKISDSKHIEELKTKISLDEKQIEEQGMKYNHLIKEFHQSKDLIGSLNSKINIIESEKASLMETRLSNKTTGCFSEYSDTTLSRDINSKSNAKKEVELKNFVIEKEEQLYQCERLIKEFTMQLNNTEEFDEISDLKHEIEAITKESIRFNGEIETAIHEIDNLQKNELTSPACIKCEINIRKYKKENAEVCEKFKATEVKMSELKSELEKSNEYLETARGEANQATNMISKFDFQNKEIEEDMKKLVKENGKEKEKTLKLAVKLKEYINEKGEYKQKVKSLEGEIKMLKGCERNDRLEVIESEKVSLSEYSDTTSSSDIDSKSNAKKEGELKNIVIEKEEQLYQCERLIKEFTMQLNNTEEFDEISDLKHEIEAITKESERFNGEIETAVNEIEKLQKNELTGPACIKCEINIRKYEKENAEVCKKFKATEVKMSELKSDLEKANEYLETARGEANQATNMISKFDFQNKEIEEDMEKLVKENGKEKEKSLKLAVKLKEYQGERVEQQQKIKSLKEEIRKLKQVSNDNDDMKVLKEKCQSLESLLESRIDLDNKEKKENKLVLEQLEKEKVILKKQVKHGSEECNSLKDQLVEMKKKLCEKTILENQLPKAENDKVGEELIKARTEITSLRMSLIEAKETADKEQQKQSLNQEELTKLKDELELKNEESNQHFKRIKELQSTILKKDKIILSKDLLLQKANENITELEIKCKANEEMIDREKDNVDNIVQDETIEEANLMISQLNEQVSAMTSAMTKQTADMEKKMKLIEIEMSTTQSKVEDQDTTIVELEEQCIMFKKQLRSKNNEVEKQNENMIEIKALLKKVEEEKSAEEELAMKTQKKLESKISKLKDYCGQLFDENNILKSLQEEKESNRVSGDAYVNSADDDKKVTDDEDHKDNGDEKLVEDSNEIIDANRPVNSVKAGAQYISEELETNDDNDDVNSDWDDDDDKNDDDALFDNDEDPMNSITDNSCDKQPLIKVRSTKRNQTFNVDGDTVGNTSIGSHDNDIARDAVVDINDISQDAKQIMDNLSPDIQGSSHQSATTTNTSGLELPTLNDDGDNDYDDVSDDESVNFDEDIDDLLNGLDEIDTKRSYTPSWS